MTVDRKVEAEIDALLAHDETTSVIDTLLAMPHVAVANDADETWEKALNARLQARLSRRLREILGDEHDRGSRSAA
jgi:allophanate hydrolase subunit 1